jgi:hypothetical protein
MQDPRFACDSNADMRFQRRTAGELDGRMRIWLSRTVNDPGRCSEDENCNAPIVGVVFLCHVSQIIVGLIRPPDCTRPRSVEMTRADEAFSGSGQLEKIAHSVIPLPEEQVIQETLPSVGAASKTSTKKWRVVKRLVSYP